VSVNITLADDVLDAIHCLAENSGLSRSGFIAKAATDAISRSIEQRVGFGGCGA
jgi:hypothetical protein